MQKLTHQILASLIFFAPGFLASSHALILAQITTATISGTAKDATGAVLPGATVTVRNTETGLVRISITDDEGRYRATLLPVGSYQVEIELAGFQREIRSGIQLTMGREAIVDLTLKVGEVTESVTVSSEAPLVETTSSSLGGLIDDRQIRNMPLNGRSIGQLTALEVGVTISRASTTPESSFNIGGARRYQTKILMDNSDISSLNNEMPTSVAGVFLGVEAVREFKVQVNNFSSEFGGSGGVVSAVTRSGTNAFHGSLLEFHRNSAFDARNFFNPQGAPPPFKRNQFGASLGGPIKKDKMFFFVNYEGLRDRENNFTINNVPTELAKQGILPPNRTVQVHSNIKPYLALLPPPNGRDNGDGTGEYVASVKTPANDDFFMARIDYNFSTKDSLYSRYSIDDAIKSTPTNPATINRVNRSRSQYFVLEETRILTPTLLNAFHVGFNRSGGSGPCEQLVSIPSSLDLIPGRPFATSGGFLMNALNITALVGCNTALRTDAFNVYEYGDNVSWNKGRHSLKSGLLVKNLRYHVTNYTEYGGVYTFTTMERLLTGRPNAFRSVFPDTDATRSWRQTLYGFFVQEDFQVKRNLTFNLGLRYEFTTSPIEVHGRSARLLRPSDPGPTVLGRGAYVETSKKDFAPRLGFAWDPKGSGKLSIRGGFGIFFEPLMPYAYGYSPGVRMAPFFRRASISNP
ncbi:MAG: TonB-dependent receptor, partial [Acidobacteria bacterium]|nr:TonB-dependent receptor [Acidobacteriota bacterium]